MRINPVVCFLAALVVGIGFSLIAQQNIRQSGPTPPTPKRIENVQPAGLQKASVEPRPTMSSESTPPLPAPRERDKDEVLTEGLNRVSKLLEGLDQRFRDEEEDSIRHIIRANLRERGLDGKTLEQAEEEYLEDLSQYRLVGQRIPPTSIPPYVSIVERYRLRLARLEEEQATIVARIVKGDGRPPLSANSPYVIEGNQSGDLVFIREGECPALDNAVRERERLEVERQHTIREFLKSRGR